MTNVYLSLGSNLGDREGNLDTAVKKIGESIGHIVRRSSFYHSAPWGFSSPNDFVNIAVCVATDMQPHELLAATQRIEREMGRREKTTSGTYHDRIIDIDILLFGDQRIDTPELTIPHPLMRQRPFVMEPLREIL